MQVMNVEFKKNIDYQTKKNDTILEKSDGCIFVVLFTLKTIS